MNRMTYIVRRDQQDLFTEIRLRFNESSDVAVIFDRRVAERRRQPRNGIAANRRRVERRRHHPELQVLGWTALRGGDAAAIALAAGEVV